MMTDLGLSNFLNEFSGQNQGKLNCNLTNNNAMKSHNSIQDHGETQSILAGGTENESEKVHQMLFQQAIRHQTSLRTQNNSSIASILLPALYLRSAVLLRPH
ncbi:hypothetical protein CEXT_709251 [Caerostris extrusa]|uniref:Uncharacterized protein n=1 Tax=Caerostris extrusa TaxID=172846 RepID=A0AAV4P8J7_CAEEX|nr:hypothetical protein CEXT_709251 [Caerostris extrusa]